MAGWKIDWWVADAEDVGEADLGVAEADLGIIQAFLGRYRDVEMSRCGPECMTNIVLK